MPVLGRPATRTGTVGAGGMVALVAAVVLAACSPVLDPGTRGRSSGEPDPAPTARPTPEPFSPSGGPGDRVVLRQTPGDLSVTLEATTRSLREFWSDQMPRIYGQPFRDLAGGIHAKTESSLDWTCGGQRFSYADIEGNAFYCGEPQDDYIAYDASSLLPRLNEQHGALTPSVVLAHEMAHAVQARVQIDALPVVRELQADCFAGAWVAFAQESASDPVDVSSAALDTSVRAIPALRDQPGTPATAPQAHGLAFDRVNAYQTGYASGAVRCAEFPQGRVVVTELPFRTATEARSGGNLPYAQTVQFAVSSLEAFWSASLPEVTAGRSWRSPRPITVTDPPLPACPGDEGHDPSAVAAYCASSNTVAWSDAALARLHAGLGDVAAASALSLAWARAGQVQAGVRSSGWAGRLQQVCATGAWVSSVGFDPSAVFSLSPGDIDESLVAVLTPLAPDDEQRVTTTSFERADAFRAGLLAGLSEC